MDQRTPSNGPENSCEKLQGELDAKLQELQAEMQKICEDSEKQEKVYELISELKQHLPMEFMQRDFIERVGIPENELPSPEHREARVEKALLLALEKNTVATYRTDVKQLARTQLPVILKEWQEFLEEGGFGLSLDDWAKTFALERSENLLDVGLVQESTRWEIRQTEALNRGKKAAQLLFGENSRAERRLDQYGQRNRLSHLKAAPFIPVFGGATATAIGLLYLFLEKNNFKIDGEGAFLVVFFSLIALKTSLMTAYSTYRVRNPEPSTRKGMSDRYQNLPIPNAVKEIVDLTFTIQENMEALEAMEEGEEKANLMQETIELVTEAQQKVKENKKLIQTRSVDYKPVPQAPEPDYAQQPKPLASAPDEPNMDDQIAAIQTDRRARIAVPAEEAQPAQDQPQNPTNDKNIFAFAAATEEEENAELEADMQSTERKLRHT